MANGTFEEIVKLGIQNRRPDLYRLLIKIGAKPMGFVEIPIKRVKRDQGIYPGEATDFERVEIYAAALEEGAVFPPILINEKDALVDGKHRIESHLLKDHETIWAERWNIPSLYLKLVAQAANTEAGNIDTPLSGKEKKRAIIQDWEDGIRDIELIATALKTTLSYVRKILSQAGLIKSRKEEMKEKAKELREQGLSYREIAKKLEEEFGEKIAIGTLNNWFCSDSYPGKKLNTTPSAPASSNSSKLFMTPEEAEEYYGEQEEEESEEKVEYARYKDTDIPLATIEYWVAECKSYVETGTPPEEAVELAGVHPNVKKYVIEELTERYWKKEKELQEWVEKCKPYVQAGFTPKEAVERAKVPEEYKVPAVKKLVGFKNHLHQEEEMKYREKLGLVGSLRRDIILAAQRIVSEIRDIEFKLKQLDQEIKADPDYEQEATYYGRDQYIRDYLTYILVRGGWDRAEWFREITKRWIRYTLHPDYAKEFIEDMKEQAKLSPEEWEEISRKFWEEKLASEAELEWKKFCEGLGLPIPRIYGGTE